VSARRRRCILAAATVPAALALAELALRALDLPRAIGSFDFLGPELSMGDVFRPDDELFWRRRDEPGIGRGWWPRGAKGPRDLRIACVGDSCTFGAHVRYGETWGVLLERALQAKLPGRRVDSVLAALPGYSTHQNRLVYERHVAPLAPDLTVLYVGGWNDQVPAVGLSDRQRSERAASWRWSLRLGRLLAMALGPSDATRAALQRGEAPFGRRVPLDDYRANVRALVALARGAGSAVLFVVPPLTERALREHPAALEYRAATRALAAELGAAALDAPALFAALRDRAPSEWRAQPEGEWPCLADWVHPSAMGHAALARALEELIEREHPELLAPAPPPAPTVTIESVAPAAIDALAPASLTVRGRGFAAGAVDRAFLGPVLLGDLAARDDHTLTAALPRPLAPGEHALDLITAGGLVRAQAAVRVRAPRLQASLARAGAQLALELACSGPAGAKITVWLATELRAPPTATQFGAFALAADPDGRLAELPQAPFRFDRLALPAVHGTLDASGAWRARSEHALPDGLRALCLQGLLLDPASGAAALTEPLRLEIPVGERR
jgi:lysophospholipase L1-like esterase